MPGRDWSQSISKLHAEELGHNLTSNCQVVVLVAGEDSIIDSLKGIAVHRFADLLYTARIEASGISRDVPSEESRGAIISHMNIML